MRISMNKAITARFLNTICKLLVRPGKLGKNSFIAPPFRISNPKALYIGDNSSIGQYAFFVLCSEHNNVKYRPEFIIGNNVQIGNDFFIGCQKRILIEDNVLISSRVFIADTTHDYRDISRPVLDQPLTEGKVVTVKENAFIGVNACILPGVCVGKNSVVAAGAIVTRDVPPYSVVAGNPAIVIKRYSFKKEDWMKITPEIKQ
jgi:acetyltransferase-like isoleucine patch superfamily enzyme